MIQFAKRLAIWASAVAIVLLEGTAVAQVSPKPVRFGLPVEGLDGLAVYVAQQRGFFRDQGLKEDVTVLRGGTGVMQALVTGDIDIAMVGPMEVSLLKDRGVDARMLMTSVDAPQFTLLAGKDANIRTVEALKGRSLGVVSPGSLTYGLARYFVTKAGLQPDRDVTIVSLGGGMEMNGALKSKKVDAIMSFEPFASSLLAEGTAVTVGDVTNDVRGFPVFALVVRKDRVDANPDLYKQTKIAVSTGLKFLKTNETEARAIAAAKFPTIDRALMARMLDRFLPAFSADGRITPAMTKLSQEVLMTAGLIKGIRPHEEMILELP